jgi:hypothetical protein
MQQKQESKIVQARKAVGFKTERGEGARNQQRRSSNLAESNLL